MKRSAFDVLCIGNAIVDVITRVDDDFIKRHGLVKGSMTLIDESQADTLYAEMGQAVEVSGGSAANTAAGLASLGSRVGYFGKVKDDQLGAIFRHDMRSQGVVFETPAAATGPATARSFILVTSDGERTMNTYLGACVNFTTTDIDKAMVEAAEVTYMEGYLWDRPEAKTAFKLATEIARGAGRRTALTLSDSFCVERHRDSFRELIRTGIDIVFANEAELKSLCQTPNFDDGVRDIARECPISVITRSEKGCVVVADGKSHETPAFPVNHVVDVTGAGDLFAAGFLHGLTAGRPLYECARLGSMAAAEVISHMGARPEVNLRAHATQLGLL
jgi:sugar/nucleoside kinase (ribokinase family)